MDERGSTNTTGTTSGEGLDAILGRSKGDFSRFIALIYGYVVMLMVTGLLGNLLVVVVFVTKFKVTNTHLFIVAMAVADLICCVVVMPLDLAELFTSSDVLCKAQRSLTAFTYTFSGYLTLVVAVDRYRRICRPLASQLSVRGAKRAIMGCIALAVACAWPQILLTGEQQAGVRRLNVTRTKCDSVTLPDGVPYDVIYYSIVSLQCVGAAVVMVVLYSIIAWKMQKRLRLHLNSPSRQDEATASTTSTNDVPDQTAADVSEGVQLQPGRTCPVPHSDSPEYVITDSSSLSQSGPCQNDDHTGRSAFGHLPSSRSGKDNGRTTLRGEEDHQDPNSFSFEARKPATISLAPTGLKMPDPAPEEDLDGQVDSMLRSKLMKREAAFRNMTYTLFLVTLIYILSFVPFIVLRVLSGTNAFANVDGVSLAVIEVFYRSLYFASVSNPVLYGIRHGEFRAKCRQLLRCHK